MTKTIYTEEEVAHLSRTALYRGRISTVLTLLLETYPGGIIGLTLADIARDYGLTLTPDPSQDDTGGAPDADE